MLAALRQEQEAAAVEAWKLLSPVQQQRLAWEAASSRADELRLTYPDLVAIGAGFRIQGEGSSLRRLKTDPEAAGTVTQEPCVICTVRRKWPKPTSSKKSPPKRPPPKRRRPGELPKCLLAYADDPSQPGARLLVAIPIDVRDARTTRARPLQGERGLIVARRDGLPGQLGILTCAIRLPGQPGVFAMGAHHVLAMSLATTPAGVPIDQAAIFLRPNEKIGSLIGGPIGSIRPGELAFDAALVQIDHPDPRTALLNATAGMVARDIWMDSGAFPVHCHVLIGGTDKLLPARFIQRRVVFGDEDGETVYFGGAAREPVHPVMLEFRIDQNAARSTEKGESGCPVVTADGTVLVGMHIGGVLDAARTIWVIPTTELFLAARWKLPSPPVLVPL